MTAFIITKRIRPVSRRNVPRVEVERYLGLTDCFALHAKMTGVSIMPACKACGEWFAKTNPHEELCFKCEYSLYGLSGYVVPVRELIALRDELYESDQLTMGGLSRFNALIAKHKSSVL